MVPGRPPVLPSHLPDLLPPHLAERTRPLTAAAAPAAGEFILYWLHHAARVDENPALDVARSLAAATGLPLLVYHALPQHAPFASDRHHTFALQGARDLAPRLAALGAAYALHVERPAHPGRHLTSLAPRAAAIVTDDFPLRPWSDAAHALAAAIAPANIPLLAVDTACLAPTNILGRAFDRAFTFRDAAAPLHAARVAQPWPALPPSPSTPASIPLPFQPVPAADLSDHDIAALCAEADIDHSLPPVPHTPGGGAAALARWSAFLADGLADYHLARNDPLAPHAGSRMSPYLHHGHISAFRLARDAHARIRPLDPAAAGAAKFLDELLIWRELAYAFCRFTPDHDSPAALPAWARRTLAAHAPGPRPALHSLETLARARTGDPLWDAAQRSLLLHGELHNNVRMTWGKAIPGWTPDLPSALATLIDLNHRHALDGSDPSSLGGILWCLGLFDRPFTPETPVLGAVRSRPTSEHARRLDVPAYARLTSASPLMVRGRPAPSIAILGAGLAGLACARALADHGLAVTLFDKGRLPGGRLSTRSTPAGDIDHGAAYLTARDPRFARAVDSWLHDGAVAPWPARWGAHDAGALHPESPDHPRFVGRGGMNALPRHLARHIEAAGGVLHQSAQITAIRPAPGARWSLAAADASLPGEHDFVVLALPPANAAAILPPGSLQELAAGARMLPCWAGLFAFAAPHPVPFDAVRARGHLLSWAARESSKPGRIPAAESSAAPASSPHTETWVVHADPAWSAAHLELTPEAVLPLLHDALASLIGPLPALVLGSAHRWRYARVAPGSQPSAPAPAGEGPESGLVLAGDWCGPGESRLEKAFLSGHAAAGRIFSALAIRAAAQP